MGCGSSVTKKQVAEDLKRSEAELAEERKKIQEKDAQIASVRQCLQEQLRGGGEEASDVSEAIQALRAELEARRLRHQQELEQQRLALEFEHQAELQTLYQERDAAVRGGGEGSPVHQDARARRAAAERAHEHLMDRLRSMAQAEASRHRAEAEAAERELEAVLRQLGPVRAEHEQAASELRDARHLLRAEMLDRGSAMSQAAALEKRLAESQEEHLRAEQRYADLGHQLRLQMKELQGELRARTEDLWQRNGVLVQRDQELLDFNCQLSDLQGLFEEVSRQLQAECSRIGRLQDTVAQCSRQKQELEQLETMLEDSHRMLSQVRDALEQERAERIKAASLLEQEQQRTQLLLEALKHFKEKLQGLTPQALLSRLGTNPQQAQALLGHMAGNAEPKAFIRPLGPSEPKVRPLSPDEPKVALPVGTSGGLQRPAPVTIRPLDPSQLKAPLPVGTGSGLPRPGPVTLRPSSPNKPKVLLSRLGSAEQKVRSFGDVAAPTSDWRRPSPSSVHGGALMSPRLVA